MYKQVVWLSDVPTAPIPPVVLKEVAKNSVVLQYYPPEDDGGSEVTGYVIQKREEKSNVWTSASNSPDLTCLVPGLVEGVPYKFRVAAENKQGTGPYTEYGVSVVPKNPFDSPDAPSTPRVLTTTPSSASISWEPPNSDGGSPITGYIVEIRDSVTGRWRALNSTPIDANKFTANNLIENSEVEFRVAAVNEAGVGKFSKASPAVVVRDPIGNFDFSNQIWNTYFTMSVADAPSTPGKPEAEKITDDSVTLTWAEPVHSGGNPVSGYQVQMKKKGSPNWVDCMYSPNNKALIKGLDKDDEIEFRIVAENEAGQSSPSASSGILKIREPPR